jgi:hypothetical protein
MVFRLEQPDRIGCPPVKLGRLSHHAGQASWALGDTLKNSHKMGINGRACETLACQILSLAQSPDARRSLDRHPA